MVPYIDLKPYVELVASVFGVPLNAIANPKLREAGARFSDDVDDLLRWREFIGGGPTTQLFEKNLAAKLDAKHAVAVANGTDAIQLALRAAGIERGHRVAIPNLTFWATLEAVVNVGATPVLIDVDKDDLQMSLSEFVRAHRARRFDGAVLVHLFGWCSTQLAEFRGFCRESRITLVEDGAQAFGVQSDGESVFADADVITTSFHPAKVIGAIGDGGAVLTNNARTAQRVRVLANHGRIGHDEYAAIGWNSRMDAIQAAWLLRALEVSDTVVENRLATVLERYDTHVRPTIRSNGYMNVRQVDDPAALSLRLHALGIETRRVYHRTLADQPAAHGAAIPVGSLMVSRQFAERVINLPLYYGMGDSADRCRAAFEEAVRG